MGTSIFFFIFLFFHPKHADMQADEPAERAPRQTRGRSAYGRHRVDNLRGNRRYEEAGLRQEIQQARATADVRCRASDGLFATEKQACEGSGLMANIVPERRSKATWAEWRRKGGTDWALATDNWRRNSIVSELKRPPVSRATTTSLQRLPLTSSG